MSSAISVPTPKKGTVIKVIGVGGAGCNAVQHMINKGMTGVEFISANTDAQALIDSTAHCVLQIGDTGLGAGMQPEVGRALAEASRQRIESSLVGAHLVFIAAGMGGGTGTGAAPIVAEIAKKLGALTVAVVSKPFTYEGQRCMDVADDGLEELSKHVDSIIIILNEKLEDMFEDDSMLEWLSQADNVLYNAVSGIAEIINVPGHINVDFNDVKTIMGEQGKAMMGVATASGEDRARKAAEQAIASPLLDGLDLSGARGVLVNITAGKGLKGRESKEIMNIVRSFAADDAAIAQGIAYDDSMGDELRVTVVATGLGRAKKAGHFAVPAARRVDEHIMLTARAANHQAGNIHNANPIPPQQMTLRQNVHPLSAATSQQASQAAARSPSVWRREKPIETVRKLEKEGVDNFDIPAYLRKDASRG
jgi:cell division protein FtsZ